MTTPTDTAELEQRLLEAMLRCAFEKDAAMLAEAAAALATYREREIRYGMGAIDAVLEACAEALGHDVVLGELPGELASQRQRIAALEGLLKDAEEELATALSKGAVEIQTRIRAALGQKPSGETKAGDGPADTREKA